MKFFLNLFARLQEALFIFFFLYITIYHERVSIRPQVSGISRLHMQVSLQFRIYISTPKKTIYSVIFYSLTPYIRYRVVATPSIKFQIEYPTIFILAHVIHLRTPLWLKFIDGYSYTKYFHVRLWVLKSKTKKEKNNTHSILSYFLVPIPLSLF